jgi:ribokinase
MRVIVVIGSSNTDLVIKTHRIPETGETVLGGTFIMSPGGKGANQATAVARLGGNVGFVAKVGDDMFGNMSLEGYSRNNIDTSNIMKDGPSASGVALITVDDAGENCIVVAPGANDRLSVADIDAAGELIRTADYLLMQIEIPMEVIEHAARIAVGAGVKVVLNPAPATTLSEGLLEKLYMITPNRCESGALTGIAVDDWESAERAADALLDKGVENVVITLGSMGSLVRNRVVSERIPAIKVEAVDTTAAGDVFNGALLVGLAENMTLVEAARFATRAAAISVTRMGAQPSIPTRKELDEYELKQ